MVLLWRAVLLLLYNKDIRHEKSKHLQDVPGNNNAARRGFLSLSFLMGWISYTSVSQLLCGWMCPAVSFFSKWAACGDGSERCGLCCMYYMAWFPSHLEPRRRGRTKVMYMGWGWFKPENNILILIPELPSSSSSQCLQAKWGCVHRASWKRDPNVQKQLDTVVGWNGQFKTKEGRRNHKKTEKLQTPAVWKDLKRSLNRDWHP